jgi:transcriptional regulator with XRE-family HTH domain
MEALKKPRLVGPARAEEIDFHIFGQQVRELRAGKGLSLAELAKQSGVSKPYISKLENGEGGRPNIQSVYWICCALGVTIEDLLKPALAASSARANKPKAQLPAGLKDLQKEMTLTNEDVDTLAKLRVAGRQPRNKDEWRHLLTRLRSLRRQSGEAS